MNKEEQNLNNTENTKLGISDVSNCKNYVVITPEGKQISVEEYMKTEDYNNRLEQQIDDFMTNKKQMELIKLFSK